MAEATYPLPPYMVTDVKAATDALLQLRGHNRVPKERDPVLELMLPIITGGDIAGLLQANKSILPEFVIDGGISPLMLAAARGHLSAVKALVSHPLVDLNRKSNDGMTALHFASLYGHAECLDYLLQRKADATIKDKNGNAAQDVAKKDAMLMEVFSRSSGRGKQGKLPHHVAVIVNKDTAPQAQSDSDVIWFDDTNKLLQDIIDKLEKNDVEVKPKPSVIAPVKMEDLLEEFKYYVAKFSGWLINKGELSNLLNPGDVSANMFDVVFEKYNGRVDPVFWDFILGEAAVAGNIAILEYLYQKTPTPSAEFLTGVLRDCIEAHDSGEIAAHLVRLGAKPEDVIRSRLGSGKFVLTPLYQTALDNRCIETFRAMMIWDKKFASKKDMAALAGPLGQKIMVTSEPTKINYFHKAYDSVKIAQEKIEFASKGAKTLCAEFRKAVEFKSYRRALGIYMAGTRRHSLLHPKVDLGKLESVATYGLVQMAVEAGEFGIAKQIFREVQLAPHSWMGLVLQSHANRELADKLDNPEAKEYNDLINHKLAKWQLRPHIPAKKQSRGTSSAGPK